MGRVGHLDRSEEAGICSSSRHPEASQAAHGESLDRPEAPVEEIPVTPELGRLRRCVAHSALLAPLSRARREDFVVAVNEGVINALEYGEEPRIMQLWQKGGSVIADVVARGWMDDPLAGKRRPEPDAPRGRGLWIANQLCDLVQLRQEGPATRLRLHMHVGQFGSDGRPGTAAS